MLPASERDLRLAARHCLAAKRALRGVEHLRAAWVADPAPDVVDGQAVLPEESGNAAVQPALDHLGELRGEHDAEAVRAEPPPERVRAVR